MRPSSGFLFRQFAAITFLAAIVFPARADSLAGAKAAFEIEDTRLNEAWAKLKTSLDEWTFEKVREKQRAWLSYRDGAAEEEARRQGGAEEGKEKAVPEYWETQMHITRSRVRMLEGWLNPGDYDDWSGEWIDGYGGLVQIVQKDDNTLFFIIQAVRGPTYHTGAVSGKAAINGQLARFSDIDAETDKSPDDGETWLNFALSVPQIDLTGANTGWYHGARAYFDGEYIRVARLTEKQSARVIAGEIGVDE